MAHQVDDPARGFQRGAAVEGAVGKRLGLIAVDGRSVRDPRAMLDMVAALPPGRKSGFTVKRNGEQLELTVEVGRRPTPASTRR